MKYCSRCKVEKPFDQFNRCSRLRDGLQVWCKACYSEYAADPKRVAQRREYAVRPENKIRESDRGRQRKYGITPREWAWMSAGGCNICGTLADLHVDHDHATGVVRGVLCAAHNKGIGFFEDDPQTLLVAAAYLSAPNVG